MYHSPDRLHVSFTFTHTTLVTHSMLGVPPKAPLHYRVARGIKYNLLHTDR